MASAQRWIFLYEEMASSKFRVESRTLTEMHNLGFSLRNILQTLKLCGYQDKFRFFIKTDSTKNAVRLLNDTNHASTPSTPASYRVRQRIIDPGGSQDNNYGKTSQLYDTMKNVRLQLLKACRG
ncbi:uncharacterized protein N7459_004919 [Penicillium hispanicum]|uniref:uncharacterized protein n=1 Tax=Penicillium hispanicum TaxID=1080232 RepID=UPI002541E7AD|nr:uncharacterized protein N7459_004919 [Penicillium hispanicum]KAJ5585119.1 hypothetical protein N7459_004919 [Penicillium hispanicum]